VLINTVSNYFGRINMPEPSFLTAKVASMIGGLFGGAAILTYIRPQTIGEAFLRGGVSVGSATVFASPIIDRLEFKNDWETQLMMGFVIGFLAYSILGMVANFLAKNRDKDIVEAVKEIKK
jgi:hypothetical protein